MTDQTDQGRPSCCCGVCPELVDGGVDCTCRDNPRCPNYQEISMPDQTPTVTAGAIRRAHEWCDLHWPTDENRTPMADVIRHYRATVPAPPATLADELRTASWGDIPALADRVEAVEKERDEARTKVEEVEGHLSKSWRQRDAKDVELERLSREREQQEKALVEHGRLLSEARAEVERLTRERLDRNPETKARVEDALAHPECAETVTVKTPTLLAAASYAEEHANDRWNLPLHRTEAGYPNCSTCDGGGCPDCTDPA